MGYMVSEDLEGATSVKIHEEDCGQVKRGGVTTTTKWHGPMGLEVAKTLAECLSAKYKHGWKNAECCVDKSP